MISFLVILILSDKTVIGINANKQLAFLNTRDNYESLRQFYGDLEPAESRYKVAAKPVPYKPPKPAPSHFEGVTPTLPVITNSQKFQENELDNFVPTVSLLPTVHKDNAVRNPNHRIPKSHKQGLSKVSLKDFLENKKKQKLLLEEEENVLEQVKQQKKSQPKTKYKTDNVIYPTTTYRPQTFHSSDIAKELGIGSYSDQKQSRKKERNQKKQQKSKKNSPAYRTLKDNRPSNYVQAAPNYSTELAYGTRNTRNNKTSKKKKKEKSGRRLRLKKVRRKKKFNKSNSGTDSKSKNNRESNSFRLKQKELKNKYQNRNRNKNSHVSNSKKQNSKKNEGKPKENKYENKWLKSQNAKKKSNFEKNNKLKNASRGKTATSFRDAKFSSSLFLEDSTGDRGSFKSIRRATKPPKYHGYENPISNYAAPADHYGGITAYNALLSEFAPLDDDYVVDTPIPTRIAPNLGNYNNLIL